MLSCFSKWNKQQKPKIEIYFFLYKEKNFRASISPLGEMIKELVAPT